MDTKGYSQDWNDIACTEDRKVNIAAEVCMHCLHKTFESGFLITMSCVTTAFCKDDFAKQITH